MNTKTMLAISALCAAVVANAEVTSSNTVGFQTMQNTANDAAYIFSASFRGINATGVIPFSSLTCAEGFADDDQIQTAYTDGDGVTQLYIYSYFGEWLDEDYNTAEGGLPNGSSAWFISSGDPKTITTSGEVLKSNYIHTFTETSALVASAYPGAFCPNSANVSWSVSDDTQIQTAYTDGDGVTQLYVYSYFSEWMDEDYNTLDASDSVAEPGAGFWIILQDADDTFAEVSPLAD